ncbi:MAG: esterase/lipase family protein [Solirubrobacteraceae bacterium]
MIKRIACLSACLGLTIAAGASEASAASTGPAIRVPTSKLQAAVQCRGNLAQAQKAPVLLIPGTFGSGQINWGWNYQKLLPTLGHPACTVTFPADGAGDIQASTPYAVWAIRMMAQRSGRKVVVIGHSQGGLEARWALRWWPDTRSDVSQVITLAAPNGGALYPDQHCSAPDSCAASLYQMRSSSNFLKTLNHGRNLTWGIPWTAIGTTSDTVFVLPPQASLRGAQNFTVQELCPDHQVGHVNLAYDGPASAIVLHALRHNGHVRLSSISRSVCNAPLMRGVTQAKVNAVLAQYNTILAKALGPDGPRAQSEPPLACYVTGSCRKK